MKRLQTLRLVGVRLWETGVRLWTGGSWSVDLPDEVQHNLRAFFSDGVFSATSDGINITYLTLYLLALGASSAQIGLMAALSSLCATLILIPGAILSDRSKMRKPIVVWAGGGITRLTLLLLAGLPFGFTGQAAVYLIIVLKLIGDSMAYLSFPAWTSLTADVVSMEWRGRYFSTRNVVMGIGGMLSTYLVGLVITKSTGVTGYQWAFLIAFLLGAISTYSYSRIREPATHQPSHTREAYSPRTLFATLRGNPQFLNFCLYSALWSFSINIAGPFFNVYMVQGLKATASMVGIVSIVSSLAALPAQRVFGSLSDKWGARRVMLLTGFLIPLMPLAWVFVREPWQVIFINIFGGVTWAGYNLASFNYLLELVPSKQIARYSAIFQMAITLVTSAGAALGGVLATHYGYILLFALSFAGRLISSLIFAFAMRQPLHSIPAVSGENLTPD